MDTLRLRKAASVVEYAWPGRLAWLWAGAVALVLFALLRTRGFDDPYITYRYAENLAAGNGFVYNPGERVLSTTTPLYTLLLALLALTGLDLPMASNAIGCLSLALGGLAFWWLGASWRTPAVGLAGLLLYPFFPLLLTTLGAETTFYIALILLGFVACSRERYRAAAISFALATLTRADGVVAAAVGGIFVFCQHWFHTNLRSQIQEPRTENQEVDVSAGARLMSASFYRSLPWHALWLYAALLLPWFAFAWFYFGTPFPVTLAAKQQQGQMVISRDFLSGLLVQIQRNYWPSPFYRLAFGLAIVGLVYGLLRERCWLWLPAWNLLYAASYTALGVSSYFWYYGPLVVGFVTLVALGIAAVGQGVALLARRLPGRGWAAGVVGLLLVAVLYPQIRALEFFSGVNDNRMRIYRAAGEWLRANTPPDASVGTLEVGIIGYYAQRPMVDFAGLIQPETARQLTPTTTYEDAAIWAVQQFRPNYLVLQQGWSRRLEELPDVKTGCKNVQTFHDPSYPFPLVIYECQAR